MKASEFFFGSHEEDNESCFPSLTYKERIIGFLVCFVIGKFILIKNFIKRSFITIIIIWIINWSYGRVSSLINFSFIYLLFFSSPTRFAIIFTFGNIFSLAALSRIYKGARGC